MEQPVTKLDYTIENQRLREVNALLLEALKQFAAKWPAGRVSDDTLKLARDAIKKAGG